MVGKLYFTRAIDGASATCSAAVIQKTGKKASIGDVLGWFGYKTNSLKGNHITSLGYPSNIDQGEQMHEVSLT